MQDKFQLCPLCNKSDSKQILVSQVQMQKCDKSYCFHKCSNCSLVYLFNPPDKNEINEFYSPSYLPYLGSKSFGKYSKLVKLGQDNIDKKRVNIVLNNFKKIDKNSRVLDFGCGNPSFLNSLQSKTKSTCIGYDLYPHGWSNQSEEYKNINLISGSIEELKALKKFNLITLWHTLEHEFHPNNLLNLFNKITEDDAIIIIEVPNYNSITRLIQNSYWAGYHTPRHSNVFTPNTLVKMMKRNGWNLEKMSLFGTMPSFTLWWLGYFDKRRIKTKVDVLNLEKYFWNFLILKLMLFPFFLFEKFFSFGVMTAVFRKDKVRPKNDVPLGLPSRRLGRE